MIELYTDGGCSPNPGKGGYGIVIKFPDGGIQEYSVGYAKTTNNRMELLSVIDGLEKVKHSAWPVTVYSDSQYVINAINKGWVFSWKRKGFKERINADLWIKLINLYKPNKHTFKWVKGHSSNAGNNRCDTLATAGRKLTKLLNDTGFEAVCEPIKEFQLGRGDFNSFPGYKQEFKNFFEELDGIKPHELLPHKMKDLKDIMQMCKDFVENYGEII